MTHPDLSTKQTRKAYRHELRMVAVRPRRAGLTLLGLAMLLIALPLAGVHSLAGWSPLFLALATTALAAPLLLASVLIRRFYIDRRMREDQKV